MYFSCSAQYFFRWTRNRAYLGLVQHIAYFGVLEITYISVVHSVYLDVVHSALQCSVGIGTMCINCQ